MNPFKRITKFCSLGHCFFFVFANNRFVYLYLIKMPLLFRDTNNFLIFCWELYTWVYPSHTPNKFETKIHQNYPEVGFFFVIVVCLIWFSTYLPIREEIPIETIQQFRTSAWNACTGLKVENAFTGKNPGQRNLFPAWRIALQPRNEHHSTGYNTFRAYHQPHSLCFLSSAQSNSLNSSSSLHCKFNYIELAQRFPEFDLFQI